MGYEHDCDDTALELLNLTRQEAGLPRIVETRQEAEARRRRHSDREREETGRAIAGIVHRQTQADIAASRAPAEAAAAKRRQAAGAELQALTARAAGVKPTPAPVAASRAPASPGVTSAGAELRDLTARAAGLVTTPATQPAVSPALAQRQAEAAHATDTASRVLDSVTPAGREGKLIADAIKRQRHALSPAQEQSFCTLRDVLFDAIRRCLLANPTMGKAGTVKTLVGYYVQWAKDEAAEGQIDPEEEAAELWENVVDVLERQAKLGIDKSTQTATAPSIPGMPCSRGPIMCDRNGKPLTRPLALVRSTRT